MKIKNYRVADIVKDPF